MLAKLTKNILLSFNSRSHTGATDTVDTYKKAWTISIHAPIRERLAYISISHSHASFNSRSLYGSDKYPAQVYDISAKFQFTLPIRERQPAYKQAIYQALQDKNCEPALKYYL